MFSPFMRPSLPAHIAASTVHDARLDAVPGRVGTVHKRCASATSRGYGTGDIDRRCLPPAALPRAAGVTG